MAKKKKAPKSSPFDVLNEQVLNNDTLTIADVKQFIADARKKQEPFKNIADRSWREIEKRNKKGALYGGNDLDAARRWTKFPLWWSCWKIRQPLTFARLPIPVLKDTQGDDPFGRTACVLGERLTRGILKTFEAFPELSSSIDDFLITDFGFARAFYRKSECVEEERVRIQEIQQLPEMGPDGMPMQDMQPMPPIFVTPDGAEVDQAQILEDEMGPYILSGQNVTVENEEVYLEAGLYSSLLVDPDVRKWNAVTRLAFEYHYSYREFIEKFGQEALKKLSITDIKEHRTGKPIVVFEYHDKFLKEVRWFAENSEDFFQPSEVANITAIKEVDGKQVESVDNSDLYGLSGFFPCTEPLLINSSTREFWPTPEYFQICDILDDIHNIVGRMFLLTKAIRVRFMFDSSIQALNSLIGETGEGGALGVPNLEKSLMNGKGSLSNLVAYFPVTEMIEGLTNMYNAFEQRLDMFYQITGLSDLIRGQTNPDSDKTFGERQMEGKFALNRQEPRQRKAQEWIKDNYQLMMEMALKMFSDKSLDEYITPQTLDQEDKDRYLPSLELLKNNKKRRFRVDFETDSTIATNEQWKRQQAIETANVITKMQESIAKTAQEMPELVESQLKLMEHVVGELTDGKLFFDEIKDSIQQVIDKVNQPKQPEFNKEQEQLKLDGARFQFDQQKQIKEDEFRQLEIQANQTIEIEKIKRDDRMANIESQLSLYKINADSQAKQMELSANIEESRANLEKEYQQLNAEITTTREELTIKKEALIVELRKIADQKDVDTFQAMLDARVVKFEEALATSQHELEKTKMMLDEKEKYATEQRLQSEHALAIHTAKLDTIHSLVDVALKHKELSAPIEQIPIKAVAPAVPSAPRNRKSKVVRDKNGDITEILHTEG